MLAATRQSQWNLGLVARQCSQGLQTGHVLLMFSHMAVRSSHPTSGIEHRAPGSLRPYERNARKHSKKQVRQIADSIERHCQPKVTGR